VAPDMPALLGDEKQIRQILTNLVRNAFDAMPEGGQLTLAALHDAGNARLVVQDTGQGIPGDRLDQIFDAFFTSKPTGTGLGLALCKKLAAQHGASMGVESEEGAGTRFTITFPLTGAPPAPSGDQSDAG
jgi:signal transduction histidine kinase